MADDEYLPSKKLTQGMRLNLTDHDLAWIGAITAHWAYAEQMLDFLINMFAAGHSQEIRQMNFGRKLDDAKRLIRSRLEKNSIGVDIGISLMVRAKELSEDRKRFGHWITSSSPSGLIRALNMNMIYGTNDYKAEIFSKDSICQLANDICIWIFDITIFSNKAPAHFFPSSHTTISVPNPSMLTLNREDFQSIQKVPPPPKEK